MQEQELQARAEEQRMKMEFEAQENDKDRQARILEAEIRAAGYGSMADINKNEQSDYRDAMDQIQKQDNYRDQMGFRREQEVNKMNANRENLRVKERELQTRERIAEKQLEVARTNKNKYDLKTPPKKK